MSDRSRPTPARRDRLIQDARTDPYREDAKHPEPSACPDCGLAYRSGRWVRVEGKPFGAEVVCPACRRIRDDYPAGFVTLEGPSVGPERDALLALARNVEKREQAEHPLKRIIDVSDPGKADRIVIRTTDMHLARSIGDAIAHAHKGELDYDYPKEAAVLRVHWRG